MIWVVNTNTNICRIYHYQKKPLQLKLLKEMTHPENKLKAGDHLTSERPGHYQTSGSARGTYSPRHEKKEVEFENFSREIAHELEKGRTDHSYNELIIIAAPHMHGLIFRHLKPEVKNLVINNIEKDFQNQSEQDLLHYLTTQAQYHDEKK